MSVENFEERGIFGAKKLSREKIEEFIQQASAQSILYKKLQEIYPNLMRNFGK